MRLGLPNESKYDLDRLMYSPVDEKGSKARNGFVKGKRKGKGKGSRKDLLAGFDRMEASTTKYNLNSRNMLVKLHWTLFSDM